MSTQRTIPLPSVRAVARPGIPRKALTAALLAAGIFSVVIYLAISDVPRGVRNLSGGPAKLSAFTDETGASVSIEAFRGRVLVLNLWAAWCVPCIQEMPSLDRLAARMPEDSFAIVAVNQDKGSAGAAKLVFKRMNLQVLKLYLDPSGVLAREIGTRGLPTTVIFGPLGEPLSYREGAAEWDNEEFVRYLISLSPRPADAHRTAVRPD
ncbi:TlpA family protein disulfide reductase [Bradyrhizobium sp.]|uniref:TlpA family protein disulfide reductase n=1 Tax=Bradyrhizobium sp. TaxID=376 RepID=UPI0040383672